MKLINECVLYKDDREERLNKLANLRNILYSEFEWGYISASAFDLIDEIPIMIIDKKSNKFDDSFSTHQTIKKQENEKVVKINKLRNSLLNVLVERSNIEFVAE